MFDQANLVTGGITKRYRQVAGRPVEDHLYAQPVGAVQLDQPRDARFFPSAVQILAALGVAAILIILAVGCGPSDVEVIAAQVAAADEAKGRAALADKAFVLTHPIPFTAVVVQSGPGIERPQPRLYVPRSER